MLVMFDLIWFVSLKMFENIKLKNWKIAIKNNLTGNFPKLRTLHYKNDVNTLAIFVEFYKSGSKALHYSYNIFNITKYYNKLHLNKLFYKFIKFYSIIMNLVGDSLNFHNHTGGLFQFMRNFFNTAACEIKKRLRLWNYILLTKMKIKLQYFFILKPRSHLYYLNLNIMITGFENWNKSIELPFYNLMIIFGRWNNLLN